MEASAAPPGNRRIVELLGQFWSWFFLLGLIVYFSLRGPGFLGLYNMQSIGANMAIVLIMALGQTFVIISGGIDLSTAFVMGLASVVSAMVMSSLGATQPLAVVVLVGLAAGVGVSLIPGLINGLLIARLGVPPFIGTLGMYGIARGFGFIFSGGQPVSVQVDNLGRLGNDYLLYYHPQFGVSFFGAPVGMEAPQLRESLRLLPYPLALVIVLVLACIWLLRQTRFGQHTYAVGGNQEAARRAGIPVERHIIKLYVLSAFFAAIAGVLYTLRFTNGAANAGEPLLLDSIAAIVIGGASLFGGAGAISGTLIGALIIAVIQNGLVIVGVNGFWQFVIVGVVIILAVLVDQARDRILAGG
jgi:ribose transport system permease protein